MLIQEKLKIIKLSTAEQIIADFLIKEKSAIAEKSVRQIAKETYTSTSACIRIAEKLGFEKWSDLKNAYLTELRYLESHFQEIDANLPFSKHDDSLTIANKISILNKETISDTISLLNEKQLNKASDIIIHADRILLFASSNVISLCEEFIYEMNRINCNIEYIKSDGEQMFRACNCTSKDCAIVVSYTGETDIIQVISRLLEKNQTPTIALTSIGTNTLSKVADVILPISTREKQYSKIASFSINTSIRLILSILYSCIFAVEYDKNLNYRINNAKALETPEVRTSNLSIIQE